MGPAISSKHWRPSTVRGEKEDSTVSPSEMQPESDDL